MTELAQEGKSTFPRQLDYTFVKPCDKLCILSLCVYIYIYKIDLFYVIEGTPWQITHLVQKKHCMKRIGESKRYCMWSWECKTWLEHVWSIAACLYSSLMFHYFIELWFLRNSTKEKNQSIKASAHVLSRGFCLTWNGVQGRQTTHNSAFVWDVHVANWI